MEKKRGISLFSLSTLLASFFGAAMIAVAFAYFNYKFSEYKFLDFHEWVFYEKAEPFIPTQERYLVLFYSSKEPNTLESLANAKLDYPILAIDYYNSVQPNTQAVTFLRSGTDTSLAFIQRFNIYSAPSLFLIKRERKSIYKQDSMIHKLNHLQELQKITKSL